MRAKVLLTSVIGALLWCSAVAAAPISSYPPATTPLNGSEQMIATQNSTTVNITPNMITSSATTTGPYPGQQPQPLPAAYQPTCLTIDSYLTQAQIAVVRAGTSTVDFAPILTAAIASHPATVQGTNPICFGMGVYNFQSTVHINRATLLSGTGGGGVGSLSLGTILTWPADTTGLVIDTAATSGTTDGSGSVIEGLNLEAQPGGTSTTAYGIQMRGKSTIRNVSVGGFAQDQIHIEACAGCGGSIEGNDNGWLVEQVFLSGNAPLYSSTAVGVNGLFIQGADANAGHSYGVNVSNVKGWGIYDNSFLGNTHIQPEVAVSGLLSRVNYLGTSYVANPTATTSQLGSTTPGTNTAVWVAIASGSYAPWTNGGTYYPGGGYACPGLSERTAFYSAYDEGGDPPSYGQQDCITFGGLNVGGWIGPISSLINNAATLQVSNTPFSMTGLSSGGERQTIAIGSADVNQHTTGTAFTWTAATNWPSSLKLLACGASPVADMCWAYSTSVNNYLQMTGPNTVNTFGRSAPFPYATFIPNLVVGSPSGGVGATIYGGCTSSPTTTGHAVGEICFTKTVVSGQPEGWILKTQGSPDTWTPLANIP